VEDVEGSGGQYYYRGPVISNAHITLIPKAITAESAPYSPYIFHIFMYLGEQNSSTVEWYSLAVRIVFLGIDRRPYCLM
jgi:hypothetical protein